MSILGKEKKVGNEETDKDQNPLVSEAVEEGMSKSQIDLFIDRAFHSFKGKKTQNFGFPVQTKLSTEFILHLTNYMENGEISE